MSAYRVHFEVYFSLSKLLDQSFSIRMMEHFKYLIDALEMARQSQENYFNTVLTTVNDHVLRLSVMTEPYYWHLHPNSDEVFIGLEGVLLIEIENETIELSPGQIFTVQKNVPHRTRPKDGRSVNLTFELQTMETVRTENADLESAS